MKSNIVIHINEYGPIRDAEIKFYPLLLFTGNSNLGKSYVNYLFYFLMQALSWSMFQDLVEKKYNKLNFSKENNSFSFSENDFRKWLVENAQPFLANFLGDKELKCDVSFSLGLDELLENGKIAVLYHREQKQENDDMPFDNLVSTININGEVSSKLMFASDKKIEIQRLTNTIAIYVQKKLFGHTVLKRVILPPGRGSYVGETCSAKEMIASQAGMYRLFLNDYDLALHGVGDNKTPDEQFFVERVKTLVDGDLITEDSKQFLLLKNGRKLPLTAAASSIKELSPFLFYLKNWSRYSFSYCMEEPEAHLHPTMQMSIADLLAACINKEMFLQLTTHSDYFLQRINQLILLGKFREQDKDAYEKFRTEHKLNSRFYLDSNDVACYFFHEKAGNVVIDKLEYEENGLPLATFFGAVRELTSFEDELAVAMDPEEYKNDN